MCNIDKMLIITYYFKLLRMAKLDSIIFCPWSWCKYTMALSQTYSCAAFLTHSKTK